MVIIFLFISTLICQVVPFETTSIKSVDQDMNNKIYISNTMINAPLDINLVELSTISKSGEDIYIEAVISMETLRTIRLEASCAGLPAGSKFFLIDLDKNAVIGPLHVQEGINKIDLGPIYSSHFIVQCIIPKTLLSNDYSIRILNISDLSSAKINQDKKYHPGIENRENPIIVVTGFWPPTNEMIRHFSQDINLNPSGWQGEDWNGYGYDVISFFPEFNPANCDNCGQGYGDLEVDYQDTSYDFWTMIAEINPSTIITFSRGFIDYSWELEYNFYNRTNWYADFTAPFFPTPNPPDSDVPTNFLRNSTLPMEEIMNEINSSDLGLNSYIDINGDPGHYVSEFMGYHGVWYHDLYQFDNVNPCYLAGHVHVGGLIDWETAQQAAELTIAKVIEELEEYEYTPGDTNDDGNVDVLDLVSEVAHILGEQILSGGSFYAGDMNSDGIINIQDIILIINLIL
jgi:hypothetical protein